MTTLVLVLDILHTRMHLRANVLFVLVRYTRRVFWRSFEYCPLLLSVIRSVSRKTFYFACILFFPNMKFIGVVMYMPGVSNIRPAGTLWPTRDYFWDAIFWSLFTRSRREFKRAAVSRVLSVISRAIYSHKFVSKISLMAFKKCLITVRSLVMCRNQQDSETFFFR